MLHWTRRVEIWTIFYPTECHIMLTTICSSQYLKACLFYRKQNVSLADTKVKFTTHVLNKGNTTWHLDNVLHPTMGIFCPSCVQLDIVQFYKYVNIWPSHWCWNQSIIGCTLTRISIIAKGYVYCLWLPELHIYYVV